MGVIPDWRFVEVEDLSSPFYFGHLIEIYQFLEKTFGIQLYFIWYFEDMFQVSQKIDALIIPGGRDLDPSFY